jgi:hypothetical protein
MIGQLFDKIISFASPDLNVLSVDLNPNTALPLLKTSANLLLMLSVVAFLTMNDYKI